MKSYSTTYAGIILTILGWVGLGHIASQTDVGTLIDNIVQAAGIIIAIYGRYKAGGVTVLGVRTGR